MMKKYYASNPTRPKLLSERRPLAMMVIIINKGSSPDSWYLPRVLMKGMVVVSTFQSLSLSLLTRKRPEHFLLLPLPSFCHQA
jgi:hypothetical protein